MNKLHELISGELSKLDPRAFPLTWEFIKTDEGRESAISAIYDICQKNGCAVQTAISIFESEQ